MQNTKKKQYRKRFREIENVFDLLISLLIE